MASPLLPPCEANCVHGDPDFDEGPVVAYDGSLCGCRRCPNFEVCGTWAPPWVYDCHNGRCMNCNVVFRKDLAFAAGAGDLCSICLETPPRMVQHPAQCGHAVCVACMKSLFHVPEPAWPEPSHFGAPDAVDGGDTGEYNAAALEAWKAADPAAYAAWTADHDAVEQQHEEQMEIRGRVIKCCPVCRAELLEAHGNSW